MSIERIRHLDRNLRSYKGYPSKDEVEKQPALVVSRFKYVPNTHLMLIGVHHGRKPGDPQFRVLESAFKSWEQKTKDEQRVIIVEGRVPNIEGIRTDEEAINSERGEVSLIALWGKRHGIGVVSGEPKPLWSEANEVAEKIDNDPELVRKGLNGKEVTAYYYAARRIPQWLNGEPQDQKNIADYINDIMIENQNAWQWDNFDFSYDNFLRIHNILYEKPFDPTDKEFFLDQTGNFHNYETLVQKVEGLVRNARDENLTNLITSYWDKGISVYSASGRSHIWIMQDVMNNMGLPGENFNEFAENRV